MSADPLRVVVADDHPIVREGLRAVIASLPDFELAAVASTGTQAVSAALEQRPAVVIMDLYMPDLDGVEATRRITADDETIAVLILTMYDDDDMLTNALRAGARGYVLKGTGRDAIARALRAVAAGDVVFGAGVADHVLGRLSGRVKVTDPFPQLSRRESEILQHLADGQGTNDIARALYVSPKTVRNHVASILRKLDVPDRAQAIAAARRAGLGAP